MPGSNPDILSNSVYNSYIQYTQELGCPCTKQKTINKYKKLILSRLKNAWKVTVFLLWDGVEQIFWDGQLSSPDNKDFCLKLFIPKESKLEAAILKSWEKILLFCQT